jgi:hypothetical protein
MEGGYGKTSLQPEKMGWKSHGLGFGLGILLLLMPEIPFSNSSSIFLAKIPN